MMRSKKKILELTIVPILCLAAVLGLYRLNSYLTSFDSAADAALPSPSFLNLAPHVDYVGDEECATCHSAIYRSFKKTGMGRSFYKPTAENVIEDYSAKNQVYDPISTLRYNMHRRDGDFYQLEYGLDEGGEIDHGLARKVDYIIGSGNHNRTYITSENGFLFEMPVTWYSEKKMWDLSPGYHTRNLRFTRPIVQECMNCHNSYAGYVEHSENRYRELPMGIGCERCHGPGALHVEQRYRRKHGEQSIEKNIDSTIVNPRHLSSDLQMDVCGQCHLQGEMQVLKEGRAETDFRPGMRLKDFKSVYIRDDVAEGDFRIASHAARVALSACYAKSEGRLVCTSCHNPHEPVQTVPRAFFNEKCAACHDLTALSLSGEGADHRAGSDCVACHMRQGATSDILHVNFTDHWIRKVIKPVSKSASDSLIHRDNARTVVLRNFFDEMDSAAELRLGIAYVKYFESRHGKNEYLTRAVPLLEGGLRRQPDHASGLYSLSIAYKHLSRLAEARKRLEKLTGLAPENALARFQLGDVLQKLGEREDAVSAYRQSLSIFSDNAVAQNNLGNVLAELGKAGEAVAAYQRALQIQPSYATAYNNLGDLYAYKLSDPSTGKTYFEKALRLEPRFAAAMLNLGNVQLMTGNEDAASKLFEKVLEIEPGLTAAHGNLALIYQRRGQREQAIYHLRKVLEVDPHDRRAHDQLRALGVSS